jgi:hypothetical protein
MYELRLYILRLYVCRVLKIGHVDVISIKGIHVRNIKISSFDSHFPIYGTYVCHITGKGKVIHVYVMYWSI